MLLQRSVLSTVMWKMSRWPYQKTVAVSLDAMQCHFATRILPCERLPTEDIDTYDRRRKRQARNFCGKIGFWSSVWIDRIVNWFDHVSRAEGRDHMCYRILQHHGASWLQERRGLFVNTRNTLFAGRTGSRSQGGRPQPRWEEGIELARAVKDQRSIHVRGSNSLSIGSRVRAALLSLREGSLHIASIS